VAADFDGYLGLPSVLVDRESFALADLRNELTR